MPEINVTRYVENHDDLIAFSASAFELGQDAGAITWRNATAEAAEHPLLAPEHLDDARDYFQSYGAWDAEEVAAWTDNDLQAMTLQEVSAQIREWSDFESYEAYQAAAESGQASGALYRGDDEQWYFHLGM